MRFVDGLSVYMYRRCKPTVEAFTGHSFGFYFLFFFTESAVLLDITESLKMQ